MNINLAALSETFCQANKLNRKATSTINAMISEQLFTELFADYLRGKQLGNWNPTWRRLGNSTWETPLGLRPEGEPKRRHTKWLDSYVVRDGANLGTGNRPICLLGDLATLPSIACEVKGWNSNSMGGKTYGGEIEERKRYTGILSKKFRNTKDRELSKLFRDWHPPDSPNGDEMVTSCPVALLIYWPLTVEQADGGWKQLDGDVLFAFKQQRSQKQVLVFSVHAYIASLIAKEHMRHDLTVYEGSPLDAKLKALCKIGIC